MNLQPLFTATIREQLPLDPGYSGHASDVWLVRTASEEVVVRASRMRAELAEDFWWGAHSLFGLDPRRVFDMEAVNGCLAPISPIPVPRVLRKGVLDGRQHVVVERMPGSVLGSFRGQPAALLEQFGGALARIHSARFDHCGAPAGALRYGAGDFHARMAATMQELVARFYQDNDGVVAELEPMCAAAQALPAPEAGALVMIDLDPTQFLSDGERITALVDTEAYAIGPRELDFINLEFIIGPDEAAAMARGYSAVLPLPDLTTVRPVYRYLLRLFSVQGSVRLDRWLAWPALF